MQLGTKLSECPYTILDIRNRYLHKLLKCFINKYWIFYTAFCIVVCSYYYLLASVPFST